MTERDEVLREALERLAEATPQSTNTFSAEGAFSYVHAVARTALDARPALLPSSGDAAKALEPFAKLADTLLPEAFDSAGEKVPVPIADLRRARAALRSLASTEARAVSREIDQFIREIAKVQLWQDVYHDGPDIMSGGYNLRPADVRAARAYVSPSPAPITPERVRKPDPS